MEYSIWQRQGAEKKPAPSVGNRVLQQVLGNQAIIQRMECDPWGGGSGGKRESRPPVPFPGMLVGARALAALDEVLGPEIPAWIGSHRPRYATGQVMAVWRASNPVSNGDGTETADCVGSASDKVTWNPGSSRLNVWDMGHICGHEYSFYVDQAKDGKLTENEFISIFQNPAYYQVEDPSYNRSHFGEAKHH